MFDMLERLPPVISDLVRPLFAPISYNLAIDSILSGLSPGDIYVDNTNYPRLAVTRTSSRIFLAGQPQEAFASALNHHFLRRIYLYAASTGLEFYTLHYTPGWQEQIEYFLGSVHPMRGARLFFSLATDTWVRDSPTIEGYEIQPVDPALLARTDLRNIDGVEEEMQSERSTIGDFLYRSFGYCAIKDGAIVAWCMSEYNFDDRCEIGIWTDENHRRRGLAVVMATAVIDQAIAEGISTIGWHCWAGNAPSIATARKLGFTLAISYPVYFAYVDQQLSLTGHDI